MKIQFDIDQRIIVVNESDILYFFCVKISFRKILISDGIKHLLNKFEIISMVLNSL